MTKIEFKTLSKGVELENFSILGSNMIRDNPQHQVTDPTMEENFLKDCLLEKELLMLKLMHNRTQMDKKLGLAKIPTGVFREITRYV